MTATARDTLDLAMSEAQLMAAVIECAERLSWRVWHDNDSRRNNPGLPDLILVRGPDLLFVELKTAHGKLRREQEAWIDELAGTYAEVHVWRPADWQNGRIERRLR